MYCPCFIDTQHALLYTLYNKNGIVFVRGMANYDAHESGAGHCFSKDMGCESMLLQIDFNSDEAIYMQLHNQVIYGIATNAFREGDALPSVRSLAEVLGVNMHTVNKAYTVLKQEGYVKIDRRRGVVIAVDLDHLKDRQEIKQELLLVLAKASCKGISRSEIHELIDEIYEDYGGQ